MDPLNSFSLKMNVKKRIDSKLTGVSFNHGTYFSSSFPLNPSEFDRGSTNSTDLSSGNPG
jgi:hypothetical protein